MVLLVSFPLTAAVAASAHAAPGDALDEALPEGCARQGDRYLCEWVADTVAEPHRRDFLFPLPVFARAEANLTIAAEGRHVGWGADVIDQDLERYVVRIDEVAEFERDASSQTYPLLLVSDPTHRHVLRFTTELFKRDRLAPEAPEQAWPGSHARFVITYDATMLPEGVPAERPSGTFGDPHLLDAARDARRPDLDVLAVWFDDARVGDGSFEIHVALNNLSAHDNAEDDESPQDVVFYRVLFRTAGAGYLMQWSWPVGVPQDWTCMLRRVYDEAGAYARRIAAPTCVFDIEGSRLSAHVPESALGSPSPEAVFDRMEASAETQLPPGRNFVDVVFGGNGTLVEDEAHGQRRPFHLATLPGDDRADLQARAAGGADVFVQSAAVAGVTTASILLLVLLPLAVLARRRRTARDTLLVEEAHHLTLRRRELYRAALERLLDDRLLLTPAAARSLAELRQRIGLDDADHERIHAEVVANLSTPPTALSDAPLAPGDVLLDRYHVQALLGEGGGGRTYRCEDVRLGRIVAVKEVGTRGDVHLVREALREARALARVHHPRVVTLLEVHELDAHALLVMEYASGGSLAQRLRDRGPLAPAEAAQRMREVLEGLAALHDAGLLHRDVKPANVLLDASGRAKLADLGLARADGTATVTGLRAVGTPYYMAPEQVLGLPLDARTDLYAAGALLYELLAGEPYVRAATREGMLVEEAIVSLPPPLPLDGTPPWANALLAALLAKDPDGRPADARAALAMLP